LIPLPDFSDDKEFVTSIECGKRNSALVTNEGDIWITGNYRIEKSKGSFDEEEGVYSKRKKSSMYKEVQ
jgi:hypothetical protein